MRLDDFLEFLKNAKGYDDRDRRKTLTKYLASPELYRNIFIPENNPNIPEDLSNMMERLSKKKFLRDLASIIQDNDYDKFQGSYRSTSEERFQAFRSYMALMYSVYNVAIAAVTADGENYRKMMKDGASRRDCYELSDHIKSYSRAIDQLGDALDRLSKKEVKYLSKKCGLPKSLCRTAIYSTPGYMNKDQISNYLSILLTVIYTWMEDNDMSPRELETIDWGAFFTYLYGKENLPDVAIYITLEGINRIDRYKSNLVRYCWDSLTFFALDVLEGCPTTTKDSMMDKYLSMVATMFANGTKDLRVNLLTLSEREYPSLVRLVDKYTTKIKDLMRGED